MPTAISGPLVQAVILLPGLLQKSANKFSRFLPRPPSSLFSTLQPEGSLQTGNLIDHVKRAI